MQSIASFHGSLAKIYKAQRDRKSHRILPFIELASLCICTCVHRYTSIHSHSWEERRKRVWKVLSLQELSADVCWVATRGQLIIHFVINFVNFLVSHEPAKSIIPLASPFPLICAASNWCNWQFITCSLCGDALTLSRVAQALGDVTSCHTIQRSPCFPGRWLAFKLSECSELRCLIFYVLCSVWLILSEQAAWAFSCLPFCSEHTEDYPTDALKVTLEGLCRPPVPCSQCLMESWSQKGGNFCYRGELNQPRTPIQQWGSAWAG